MIKFFSKNAARYDGLQSSCKSCWSKYRRSYYIKNKDYEVQRGIDRRNSIRSEITKYKKSKGCNSCPENHAACLEFHHTGNDKGIDIAQAIANGWSLERIYKEIDKCIILCANCHRKLHHPEKDII